MDQQQWNGDCFSNNIVVPRPEDGAIAFVDGDHVRVRMDGYLIVPKERVPDIDVFIAGLRPASIGMAKAGGSKAEEAIIALVGQRQDALRTAGDIEAELALYGVRISDTPHGIAWSLQVQVPEEPAALKPG